MIRTAFCVIFSGGLCPWTSLLASSSPFLVPVEEKIRYEQALEGKLSAVIDDILGPGLARVSVELTLEKPEPPAKPDAPGGFKWAALPQGPGQGAQELLPGFFAAKPPNPYDETPAVSQGAVFLPFMLKKISVNVILDRSVDSAQGERINEIVTSLLALDFRRGDSVNIIRAPFLPAWKAVLQRPDSAQMLMRYGLISVIVLLSMTLLAAAVMRLAGAMRSVSAPAQEHQISMDFGGGKEKPGELPAPEGESGAREEGERLVSAVQEGEILFEVKPKHVPLLKFMLENEAPENIALIVMHLPVPVRKELMSAFGAELSSQVLLNLATVRFVDREVVLEVKEELEKKLNSALGGVPKVIEFMGELGFRAKKQLVAYFEKNEPRLAAEIRGSVLLDDDLERLSDQEVGLLAFEVTLSDWGTVLSAFGESFRGRLKSHLPDKSWHIIEQNMKFSAGSPENTEAALEKVIGTAARLMSEGRIKKPPLPPRLLTAAAPAPPAPPKTDDAKGGEA